jgi:CMP-N-acetylneuraminic acid synthetase
LISVKPSSELPFKSFKLKNSKLTPLFNEESLTSNRQELPKTFYPNGAIYIFSIDAFITNNYQLPLNDCTPFIMSQSDSIDIDSHFDLKIAEEILNSKSI